MTHNIEIHGYQEQTFCCQATGIAIATSLCSTSGNVLPVYAKFEETDLAAMSRDIQITT